MLGKRWIASCLIKYRLIFYMFFIFYITLLFIILYIINCITLLYIITSITSIYTFTFKRVCNSIIYKRKYFSCIYKPYFQFCRMHICINNIWINSNIYNRSRKSAIRNKSVISINNCLH